MARKKTHSNGLYVETDGFKGVGFGIAGVIGVLIAFGGFWLVSLGGLLRVGGAAATRLLIP